MKRIRIIEMPKDEIRLDALEQALIEAGDNCGTYSPCKTESGAMRNKCMTFNTAPCACGGELFCFSYML